MALGTPRDPRQRAGIVSMRFDDPATIHRALRDAGIAHSMREGLVRLAPHVCNTMDEIERTIAVLEGAWRRPVGAAAVSAPR